MTKDPSPRSRNWPSMPGGGVGSRPGYGLLPGGSHRPFPPASYVIQSSPWKAIRSQPPNLSPSIRHPFSEGWRFCVPRPAGRAASAPPPLYGRWRKSGPSGPREYASPQIPRRTWHGREAWGKPDELVQSVPVSLRGRASGGTRKPGCRRRVGYGQARLRFGGGGDRRVRSCETAASAEGREVSSPSDANGGDL